MLNRRQLIFGVIGLWIGLCSVSVWGQTDPDPLPDTAQSLGIAFTYSAETLDEHLAKLTRMGAKQTLVELPSLPSAKEWQSLIEKLEKAGFQYFLKLGVDASSQVASGWQIQPERFRLVPSAEGVYSLNLPGAQESLIVIADRTDASVKRMATLELEKGQASLALTGNPDLEVFLLYPHGASSMPDLWEGWDQFRDRLLHLIDTKRPGANLRGWIQVTPTPVSEDDLAVLPDSLLFQKDWSAYLRTKYRDPSEIERAWQVETKLESFERASQLIPMWRLNRGVPFLWLPNESRAPLLPVNTARSEFWKDYRDFLRQRLHQLSASMQKTLKEASGNAPVFLAWQPALPEQTALQPLKPSEWAVLDGICLELPAVLREQWGLFLAQRAMNAQQRNQEQVAVMAWNAEIAEGAPLILARARSMNYQHLFWRVEDFNTIPQDMITVLQAVDSPARAFSWQPFPMGLWMPAEMKRLTDGRWWIPVEEGGGEPLGWGSRTAAYWRMTSTDSGNRIQLCVWSLDGVREIALRRFDKHPVTVESTTGQAPEIREKGERLFVKIGPEPILITGFQSLPVCETSVAELQERFNELEKVARARNRDFSIPRFTFRQSFEVYNRNPAEGYRMLSSTLAEAEANLRPYVWIEAEAPVAHTFGAVRVSAAASRGASLWLNTLLSPPADGFYADYSLLVSGSDYILWLARASHDTPIEWSIYGSSPDETVPIAKGNAPADTDGRWAVQGGYGGAYYWVRLGALNLPAGEYRLRLKLAGGKRPVYAAEWDAILVAPPDISPWHRFPPVFK